MKITGLTRRVDSLGRIVIPKELRRMLHIKEGSPLEIYMDADETIVLKKYSQVGSLKNISQAYAQSLSKVQSEYEEQVKRNLDGLYAVYCRTHAAL